MLTTALFLAVVVSPQNLSIEAPSEPVPLGQMVELRIETDLPHVIVQAIGRKGFDVVKVYQSADPSLWLMCGPEDEYLVTATASGPDGLAQQSVKLLIGPRPPPGPEEPPEEPEPQGPKSTAIIYPNRSPPPQEGQSATNQLRDSGETVFFVNAGTTTIEGQTPAFLAPAIEEAKKVGLPTVVVMYGDQVKASQKLTTAEAAVAFVEAN